MIQKAKIQKYYVVPTYSLHIICTVQHFINSIAIRTYLLMSPYPLSSQETAVHFSRNADFIDQGRVYISSAKYVVF